MSKFKEIASIILGIAADKAVKSGKVSDNAAKETSGALREIFGKSKSITSKASGSIFSYPVVVSEGVLISDEDLITAICRYLESQYAVFTMIAMGIDPVMKNSNTRDHIQSFYSREDLDLDYGLGLESTVSVAGEDEVRCMEFDMSLFEEYMVSSEADNDADYERERERKRREDSKDRKDKLSELPEEREAKRREDRKDRDDKLDELPDEREAKREEDRIDRAVKREEDINDRADKREEDADDRARKRDEEDEIAMAEGRDVKRNAKVRYTQSAKIEKKLRNSEPTVIKVEVIMDNANGTKIEIPLAIKATPQIVTAEESRQVFENLRNDKPLVLAVKLLTGQVKLFRDIILQVEKAKKDKELYKKLGRHPWFRQVTDKRDKSRFRKLLQQIPFIKDFVKGKTPDVLPICSLVVTKDEIEQGMGQVWSRIKKSDNRIMEKFMLLALVVVDTQTGYVEFDYYGMDGTNLVRCDDLKKDFTTGNKDASTDEMSRLLSSLIFKS